MAHAARLPAHFFGKTGCRTRNIRSASMFCQRMKNYLLRRLSDQPILTTADVRPAVEGFRVLGAFNPAVCRFGDEIIMLLRVAEAPAAEPGWLPIPLIVDNNGVPELTIKTFPEPTAPYDPRVVSLDGITYLTSLSHLRLARSRDGIHFAIDEKPFLFPARMDESFGIEDARITYLEGKYWITYTAVSEHGPGVGLAVTTDFATVERVGMILPAPEQRRVPVPRKGRGQIHAAASANGVGDWQTVHLAGRFGRWRSLG